MGQPARKPWSKKVGGYGYTVTLTERRPGGPLSVTYWEPSVGKPVWHALHHLDRVRGEKEALRIASDLQLAKAASAKGLTTVAAFFTRFEHEVTRFGKGQQPEEDARRMAIWRTVLGPATDINGIDRGTLDRFIRLRRAGEIQVPGHELRAGVSERTIGADLEFLRRALNWGRTVKDASGRRLITEDVFTGFAIPKTASPKRPLAPYDRWQLIRAVADDVDPQHLFGGFMDLLDWLGWRVSALCQLRIADVDLTPSHDAPTGRVRKAAEFDKENVEMWVPIPPMLRDRLAELMVKRTALHDAPPAAPLFPAPRSPEVSWSRFHARTVLRRAERAADLPPIEGGQFHPYRRAWVSSRKHHPLADIAAAGGWKGTRALELYMKADPETTLNVVSSTNRIGSKRQEPTPKLSKTLSKARHRDRN